MIDVRRVNCKMLFFNCLVFLGVALKKFVRNVSFVGDVCIVKSVRSVSYVKIVCTLQSFNIVSNVNNCRIKCSLMKKERKQ